MYSISRILNSALHSIGLHLGRFPIHNSLAHGLGYLFDRYQIQGVLDVGARLGEYGVFLRKMGYKGPLYSFEPIQANYRALQQKAQDDPNWNTFELALGSTAEHRRINITSGSDFASFLKPNSFGEFRFKDNMDIKEFEEVEVVRLDSFVVDKNLDLECVFPVVLKSDTQGFDLEVLAGAERVLDHIAIIQVEVAMVPIYVDAPAFSDVNSYLLDKGFVLYNLYPLSRNTDKALIECDALYINKQLDEKYIV